LKNDYPVGTFLSCWVGGTVILHVDPKNPSEDALMLDIGSGIADAQRRLRQFLQENSPLLLGIIRSYIVRMGLARGEAVQATAADVLHDTALEALAHADRFDPATQPRAWLLAIAANVLKRKKANAVKRHEHEVLVSDLSTHPDDINESDFFDQVIALTYPGPEQDIETREQVIEMLSLVSSEDQKVLRLSLLHDLDTSTLAQILGVTPGAARVRLHRALSRLRTAWSNHERHGEKGKSNA
jgi:RNA polymerase sigma factor (sigma-70 family)